MDPLESFDGLTDRSDIVQPKQWLNKPVQEVLGEHIKSLMDFPPAQKAATFDFNELMKSLMSGKQ